MVTEGQKKDKDCRVVQGLLVQATDGTRERGVPGRRGSRARTPRAGTPRAGTDHRAGTSRAGDGWYVIKTKRNPHSRK